MADFAKCAAVALKFEGVNPEGEYREDGGVPSKFGVTPEMIRCSSGDIEAFDKNGDGRITNKDIKKLTFDDAVAVYKQVYWDGWGLDALDDNQKALLALDASLNHGRKVGAKIIQKALIALGHDAVVADGVYGPQTRKAMDEASTEEFVDAYFASRKRYYEALADAYSNQKPNLPKWMARLDRLKEALNGL